MGKQEKSAALESISLFSGAMGLDIGLERSGIHCALAQDIEPSCVKTMNANGRNALAGDIREMFKKDPSGAFLAKASGLKRGEAFLVAGGPPCQAFSTAGKRKGLDDARGALWMDFSRAVEIMQPRFFIMENVKGLLSMDKIAGDKASGLLFDEILKRFAKTGYKIIHGVLDASHYGAAQFRERVAIIGSRDNEPIFLPRPTHFPFHQNPSMRWRSLRDAIWDLRGNPGAGAKFSESIGKWLKKVPPGGNWKSLPKTDQPLAMGGAFESGGGKAGFYRRLSWDEPAPTLVTSPIQKATMLCHPEGLRALSVLECARIQGFPDDWKIEGKTTERYRQIGNAVPCALGEALGQMLVSVALGDFEVKTRRARGTSAHKGMALSGE